jgi:hypothetical protein
VDTLNRSPVCMSHTPPTCQPPSVFFKASESKCEGMIQMPSAENCWRMSKSRPVCVDALARILERPVRVVLTATN